MTPCRPRIVEAAIDGEWTEGIRAPALVIRVADVAAGSPDERTIASVRLADPFFATELRLEDLCADDGTTADEIAVRCVVGHGSLARVRARKSGAGFDVTVDGEPPKQWVWPRGPACFSLRGFGGDAGALESLRASWGRDEPSPRCAGSHGEVRLPVRVDLVRVAAEAEPDAPHNPVHCIRDSGPVSSAALQMSLPSLRVTRDLGWATNLCGGVAVTRYTDADAVPVVSSDDGTDTRWLHRLGDSLYFTSKGGISKVDVPCGARPTFEIKGAIESERVALRAR